MLATFFVLLLLFFLASFFGLEYFDVEIFGTTVRTALTDYGISLSAVRVFLGIGIAFCEMAIIALSMLDRIGDTIKETIRPLMRLIPLGAFLTAIWNTFSPIIFSLLPAGVAQAFGTAKNEGYITQAVNNGTFSEGVILTLATMLFFILTTYALGRHRDSAEVRALRAELAKYKKLV